jgi:hypothetical protein
MFTVLEWFKKSVMWVYNKIIEISEKISEKLTKININEQKIGRLALVSGYTLECCFNKCKESQN